MADDKKTHTPKDSHYAKLRRAYRDQKPRRRTGDRPARETVPAGPDPEGGLVRLYGIHTVRAALDNPRRKIRRMLVTRNAMERLGIADLAALPFPAELVEPRAIDSITGSEAVHQGVADRGRAAAARSGSSALTDTPLVIVLDQVTDPHNVGAIMRSAVAFGAGALITTSRHSPHESGVLAKSASGALEHIDLIEVKNLAEALGELHDAGFQTIGLDSDGPAEIGEHLRRRKDRAGARRRGQGPAPEDARDGDRARPPRHARRHPLAQRVERGGGGALCGAAVFERVASSECEATSLTSGVSRKFATSYSPLPIRYSLFTHLVSRHPLQRPDQRRVIFLAAAIGRA